MSFFFRLNNGHEFFPITLFGIPVTRFSYFFRVSVEIRKPHGAPSDLSCKLNVDVRGVVGAAPSFLLAYAGKRAIIKVSLPLSYSISVVTITMN